MLYIYIDAIYLFFYVSQQGVIMKYAGLDIGSRTIKLVVVEHGKIILTRKTATTYNPIKACEELLRDVEFDKIIATGYGRHLFSNYHSCDVITEIKAFALGASFIDPSIRTVLDIGGQDTKAIAINETGGIVKFEMNDKCAAGTGRFLEIMAAALGYNYNDFASEALRAGRAEAINNTCTVFAESEVISLMTRGIPRDEISLGIHRSIVSRTINLLKRVSIRDTLLFAGGVALNTCIKELLTAELGIKILLPDDPQIVGALGCAVYAMNEAAIKLSK